MPRYEKNAGTGGRDMNKKEYVKLGGTGIEVSRFCFGTLTMGPLQRNIPVEEGGNLIRLALEQGVTFLDTAQNYKTYGHIRHALDGFDREVVIASKSALRDYGGMETAVKEALKELNRDYIDVFLMHAVQRADDLEERLQGAWRCLEDMKKRGIVRAIGLSTHNTEIVERALNIPGLDVLHPIVNKIGFGLINEGNKNLDMLLKAAYEKGIGLYAMKPLAGGHLHKDVADALTYVFDHPYLHAVAVGMVKQAELNVNLKVWRGGEVSAEEFRAAQSDKRMYVVPFCKGCEICLEACEQGAISMVEGKAFIDHDKCILCGYCRRECPHSMIRII